MDTPEIAGTIPSYLWSMTNLRKWETLFSEFKVLQRIVLLITGNLVETFQVQIQASLPSEIGELTNLGKSDNCGTTTVGDVSHIFRPRAHLHEPARHAGALVLGGPFGGSLPTELGNLSNLMNLVVSNSQVSGSVPSELGKLSLLGKHQVGSTGTR